MAQDVRSKVVFTINGGSNVRSLVYGYESRTERRGWIYNDEAEKSGGAIVDDI